jgi:hypothetical protein
MFLQTVVGVSHHQSVEPNSRHHCESFSVQHSDVEATPIAMETHVDGTHEVDWDIQIGCQKICRASGQYGEVHGFAGDGVNTALHRAVPAPYEQQLRSVSDNFAR